MPSERNKKFTWLMEQFELEFSTKVEREELSNDQPFNLLKESGEDFLIQILKSPQVSSWENRTHTDHYQVNIYISSRIQEAREITERVYNFMKYTVSGVDAGDIFFNTSQSKLQNYWFRLMIHEGV